MAQTQKQRAAAVRAMAPNRSAEELAMRDLVIPKLRARWPDARIIHELPLRYSTRRIDLAAVTEREIVSVEIKSSADVIDRLEQQLRAFAPISSRIIVALAPVWNEQLPTTAVPRRLRGGVSYTAHVAQRTEAQAVVDRIVCDWVEIWTVDAAAGAVEITEGEYRSNNRRPWLGEMLHMLHAAELADIAARHRIAVGKRPTHEAMVQQCHDLMQGREIVAAVCAALRARDAFVAGTDAPIAGAA